MEYNVVNGSASIIGRCTSISIRCSPNTCAMSKGSDKCQTAASVNQRGPWPDPVTCVNFSPGATRRNPNAADDSS